LKEQAGKNKESLLTNKLLIESAQEKVAIQQKHVASLAHNRELVIQSLQHDHATHVTKMTEYEEKIVSTAAMITSLIDTMSDKTDLQKKLTKLNKLDAQIQTVLTKQKKSLSFFEDNEHCPTCQQGIETAFRTQQIEDLRKKIAESVDGIQKMEQKVSELETMMSKHEETEGTIRSLESNITAWKQSVSELRRWITDTERKIKELQSVKASVQDEQTQLEIYEQSVLDLQNARQELLTHKQYLEAASVLLKDTGIKTKIVQQYLPIINTVVNKYLLALDFSVNFVLDEAFNETIKSRYRDEFQYASFSEGEKQRIDMALMLTWRAVAKLKNSMNTNLLILDEVFDSSLDTTGAEELLKILTVLEGTNVFVISHRGDVLQDKFQHVIRFRKQHNFSQVML
jgi:DNA repair exonuclease SbcCD ATPase subunit